MKKWIFPLTIAVFSAITTSFVQHWLTDKEKPSVETITFESATTQPVSLRLQKQAPILQSLLRKPYMQ